MRMAPDLFANWTRDGGREVETEASLCAYTRNGCGTHSCKQGRLGELQCLLLYKSDVNTRGEAARPQRLSVPEEDGLDCEERFSRVPTAVSYSLCSHYI